MRYIFDKNDKKPMYIRLYEEIRDDIVAGVYTADSKLPSKRLISEEAGVSVITAEHAYELLIYEGYIEARERSGYFVIYRAEDYLGMPGKEQEHTEPHNHIRPEKNDFPFSTYARTMRKVLSEYGEELMGRIPNKGCERLREVLKNYLIRSRGMHVTAEQIIIGSGAEYLYGLIGRLLCEKTFGLEYPSYEKISMVYEAAGLKCINLKMGKEGIKTSEIKNAEVDVLHISPYRSYPTGATASISKRMEYIRWAEKEGRILIEDDYESEFSVSRKSEETLFSMSRNENVIYVNSFSMTIMPSIRMAYMIIPKLFLKKYEERNGFYSCPVPYFEQLTVAEFIESGDFERHINRVRRKKRKNILTKYNK